MSSHKLIILYCIKCVKHITKRIISLATILETIFITYRWSGTYHLIIVLCLDPSVYLSLYPPLVIASNLSVELSIIILGINIMERNE